MKKGFTLMEILIVVAILGILAALISGNFLTSLKKSRDAKRKTDLEQIQKALEMYYEDKKAYPTQAAGAGFPFGSTFSDTVSGKAYMIKVSNDPSGTNYKYEYDATNKAYSLYACLENTEQVLPYESSPTSFSSCTTQCYKPDKSAKVSCIWGISSSNTTP